MRFFGEGVLIERAAPRLSELSGRPLSFRNYSRLTFSPFMARFIVRTEHMAPHMVQVLGSAGLVDAT